MKKLVYFLLALPIAFAAMSCEKKEIEFSPKDLVGDRAQFQVLYVEPIANTVANGLDSLFINGKLYNNRFSSGQLKANAGTNNCWPYPNGFYATEKGVNHITIYRGANIVYDRDITLNSGKQMIAIYDLTKDPVILDDEYPYPYPQRATSAATFDTDSLASFRLINFLHNSDGTPYTGKLQYQYSNNSGTSYTAGDWYNIGEPVGFGEQTERSFIVIHKTIKNDPGSQIIRFRCLDQTGTQLTALNDYWRTYIGRANTHVLAGRLGGSPAAHYCQLVNNIQ